MKKFILILSALAILISCSDDEDTKLTMKKKPYFGNELKIDGYYYYPEKISNIKRYHIIFLFENGVLLYGVSHKADSLEVVEDLLKSGIYNDAHDTKHRWGVFEVEKDNLIFERWVSSSWPEDPIPVKYFCRILNDTTFNIYKTKNPEDNEFSERDEIYHYRQFDHKPDSTNNFIK